MLWDILGIIIGFAAVMLLLSLLVTSASQLTQHLLGLRQKNLELGLEAVLNAIKNPEDDYQPEAVAKDAVQKAQHVMPERKHGVRRLTAAISRPQCSELTPDEVGLLVTDEIGEDQAEEAKKNFPRSYKPMQRRFALIMRYWALAWAFVIAILFQVSTPELLSRLSTDPELRQRYEDQADLVLARASTSIDRLQRYQDVSADALAELERRHPDLGKLLEQASGIGKDRATIVRELSYVLEDVPDQRDALVQEYGEILDEQIREGLAVAKEEITGAVDLLSLYDVGIWSRGAAFYTSFEAWFGVLITAVLLTLGAPFWFNVLRGAQNMRDVLGGGKDKSTTN